MQSPDPLLQKEKGDISIAQSTSAPRPSLLSKLVTQVSLWIDIEVYLCFVSLHHSFKKIRLEDYADNYFDFKFSLEDLFNREIDLLEEKAIKNPYLLQSINSAKQLVYEA